MKFLVLPTLALLLLFQAASSQAPTDPGSLKKYQEAEALYADAERLAKGGDADKAKAIEKYIDAAGIYLTTGSAGDAAVSIHYAADLLDQTGKTKLAIDFYLTSIKAYQTARDRSGEASATNDLAGAYSSDGQKDKAIETYMAALDLYRQEKDREHEGAVLNRLGLVYAEQKKSDKAIEAYESALVIARELQSSKTETVVLSNAASAYRQRGDLDVALSYYRNAAEIDEKLGDQKRVARSLNSASAILAEKKAYPEAIALRQRVSQGYERAGDSLSLANSLVAIGNLYTAVPDNAKAIEYYEKALAAESGKWSDADRSTVAAFIARSHNALKDTDAAAVWLKKAIGFAVSGKPESVPALHNELGNLWHAAGKFELAITSYESALEGWKNDKELLPVVLRNLAGSSLALKQNDKAIEYYEKARVAFKASTNRVDEAANLYSLGEVYLNNKQPDKALEAFTSAEAMFRALDNKDLVANSIGYIGAALYDKGEKAKAVDSYEASARLAHEIGHTLQEIAALEEMGAIRAQIGEGEKGFANYLSALEVRRKGTDKRGLLVAIDRTATLAAELNKLKDADIFFQQAIALAAELNDKRSQMLLLNAAAQVANKSSDPARAIELYDNALSIAKELNDIAWEGKILFGTAHVYGQKGDRTKSLSAKLLARERYHAANDPESEQVILSSIAEDYEAAKEFDKAIAALSQSVDLLKATNKTADIPNVLSRMADLAWKKGDKLRSLELLRDAYSYPGQRLYLLARTYIDLASYYDDLGDWNKALEILQLALSTSRKAESSLLESQSLYDIGRMRQYREEMPLAIDAFEKALEIDRRSDDLSRQALTLGALSKSYEAMGDYAKAIELLQESLTLARRSNDTSVQMAVTHDFAVTYGNLGDYKRALDLSLQELALIRQAKKPVADTGTMSSIQAAVPVTQDAESSALNSIGYLYGQLQDEKQQKRYLEESLAVARAKGAKSSEEVALNNLASTYYRQGSDNKKALELTRAALALAIELGDQRSEAAYLLNVASILEDTPGGRPEALDALKRSLTISRAINFMDGERQALWGLAMYWKTVGNPSLAVLFGKQAINLLQAKRGKLKSLDANTQKAFLSSTEQMYRSLSDQLIAIGRIAEAEQVLAMLKEEETFSFLKRGDGVAQRMLQNIALSEKEKTALTRYNEIADKITAIGKEADDLAAERKKYEEGKFPQQARYDEVRQQLKDAQTAFQAFLDELKVTFGQKDERVAEVASSLSATLQRLKADRTAVVSTIVGDDRLNIIVTTSRAQRAHTVNIGAKELNKLVAEFRTALTSDCVCLDPNPAGQKLYNALVREIEDDLKGIDADTILWSLDGTLRYLPVAAIWDEKKGYMAERFSNVVLTLASRSTLESPITDRAEWKALGVGVSKEVDGFPALTAVPDELDCIITDAGKKTVAKDPKCSTGVVSGVKLLDDKFTAQAFADDAGEYSIVHIASHFNLNPGKEDDSFLLLGGGDNRKFTIADLRAMSLANVELLVLSACNTATPGGEKENGVEIESFGATAQQKGAKAVMATLWPVADESTRDLMVRFYELYDKKGMSKAAALKQAQVEMLKGGIRPSGDAKEVRTGKVGKSSSTAVPTFKPVEGAPFAHPYYWAPFVLYGNWR